MNTEEEFIVKEFDVDAGLAVRFGLWNLVCVRSRQRFCISKNVGV